MKIVAIGMAKNEADIVGECVTEALSWVDKFVVYDHASTDGTAALARAAGAIVIPGDDVPFDEALRQHTVDAATEFHPDWLIRIDMDEIYHPEPNPRQVLEEALAKGAACVRALQLEFWLTLADVAEGLFLEDERVGVQKRRRWYTCGHMAMVAWVPDPRLRYRELDIQKRRNVPVTEDGRDVSQIGETYGTYLVQKHYNCRSIPQLMRRMQERTDYHTFGKYRYNLIIDENIGLHFLGPDDMLCFRDNHERVYQWYKDSQAMLEERQRIFGWNH